MKVTRLDRSERRGMRTALLEGDPISLELWSPPPPEVRLDDIVPLCQAVRTWDRGLTRSLSGFLPPAAMPGAFATVSAVIPSHRRVPWGLRSLLAQDVQVEVLLLDNGRDALRGEGLERARVARLPWEGHGRTRQRGVELARGEYVFLSVDDAIPCGAGFLRTLIDALEDGGFDAVFARQLPWPDSDQVTARRLRAWTPPGGRYRRVERLDNVAALYRRSTLLEHPLPDVPIAEDLRWAQGRRIGYVPAAPVVHAHVRRPLDLFRRNRSIHAQHLARGEAPAVPDLGSLLRALPGVARPVAEAGPAEVLNSGAELVGQWAAARRARRGS